SVAAVAGFIIGLPTLRLKGDYLAITTLAFGEIVRNVFKNIDIFGGPLGMSAETMDNRYFIILAFVIAIIIYFLIQNLVNSKHGRAVKAIRDNEIAAKAMGVNITKYKLIIFVISAFFAGVAGVLYGHTTTIVPAKFDYNYSIMILVMVVLGGMGNMTGSIIAAILLTTVDNMLGGLPGDLAGLRFLIYAIVLIFAMMYTRAPFLEPLRKKLKVNGINNFIRTKILKRLPLGKVNGNVRPISPDEMPSEDLDLAMSVKVVNDDKTIETKKGSKVNDKEEIKTSDNTNNKNNGGKN
ncbi:MAG: branched-chain amino acid ABC transporter permease, partial [Clostridia bacterium]